MVRLGCCGFLVCGGLGGALFGFTYFGGDCVNFADVVVLVVILRFVVLVC